MANPFDLHTILLAKHAQHVVLIHFPIALFAAGVAFDLLSGGKPESSWTAAAYFNLTAAALTAIPAIITGLLAWQFALDGKRLRGLLLLHLLFAVSTLILMWFSCWTHRRARKSKPFALPRHRIAIEVLGVFAIALTTHLGGFLSGVNL